MKPKPSDGRMSRSSALLSKPAARPPGLVQVIDRTEGPVQFLKVVFERVLGVNVERRAVFLHERLDRNALAEQLLADILKIMHGAQLCRTKGAKSNS